MPSDSEEDDKVINLRDHRWVEVGSDDWAHEVMQAINECIDRLEALEGRMGQVEGQQHAAE